MSKKLGFMRFMDITDVFEPLRFVATRDSFRVIEMRIEAMDGTVLAEYPPEYVEYIRKIYGIKRNRAEAWVFTEKGLFLRTEEIGDRYRRDEEKMIEYYRSDEAVRDLQAMLEAGR